MCFCRPQMLSIPQYECEKPQKDWCITKAVNRDGEMNKIWLNLPKSVFLKLDHLLSS